MSPSHAERSTKLLPAVLSAHATVWITEPGEDTWLCLLFTAQDNTTDTQLSQCLAKISTWKSRSWPGLRLSRTEVRLVARGKGSKEHCSSFRVRTHAHGLSGESVLEGFFLLIGTELSHSNICEQHFVPCLISQKAVVHPRDDPASEINALLTSQLAVAL